MECPTPDLLRQLCLDQIAPEQAQSLTEHLEHCSTCRTAIDELSGVTPDSTRALQDDNWENDSKLLRERLRQLKAHRPPAESTSNLHYRDLEAWIDEGDSEIGRVAHFDLVRCIGRGGMGVVFEAFDRELQRVVALKMMSPALLVDPASSQRFLREAQAAAAVTHAAVAGIFAVSSAGDLPYLVMEFIDGESLQAQLETSGVIDLERVIDIAAQLSDGLAEAHAQGVIHRDVKPANILIQRDSGAVKLTDFGLAYTRSSDRLTQTGALLGTPQYLAPEQINGGEVDHRSDLFSLGSVIYHMCAGRPPFGGNSIATTLQQVAASEPTSLREINPRVPAWLSTLVKRLHSKLPEDRFSDAHAVAAGLRAGGERGVAPGTGRRRRLGSLNARRLGVFTMLLVGLVVVAVYSLNRRSAEPLPARTAEQLAAYLEGSHDGTLFVELTSHESYELPQFTLESTSVRIRALKGTEPVLQFHLASDDIAIHCLESRLELEGVRIELIFDEGESDEEGEESVISCVNGSLTLTDCEIDAADRPCIELVASDGTFTRTILRSQSAAIVSEPRETSKLTLESSEVFAETAVGFPEGGHGVLHINESVFETAVAIEMPYESEPWGPLSVRARGNHFDCQVTMLAVFGVESSVLEMPQRELTSRLPFVWQGTDNDLPEFAVVLTAEGEEEERSIRRADW